MMPKYLIELVAFSMLLSLPIYRSLVGEDYRELVPFVALFAYAGYRLLPNLQQVYSSLSILKFNAAAVEYLGKSLDEARAMDRQTSRLERIDREILFERVGYTYPGSDGAALTGLSLRIAKGEKVAIVGLSGSGKTTFLDIILGLVSPTEGRVLIDGVDFSGKTIGWSTKLIGYAPQSPLILGASVAENIAFGIAREDVNEARCQEVVDFALANDFVANLPQGMSISIARAFYHSPEIVVLDEPSSALDPILSARLFDRLCSKGFTKTVIAVTHDWEVLPAFDKVILLDAGKVIGIGTYAEVAGLVEDLRLREM